MHFESELAPGGFQMERLRFAGFATPVSTNQHSTGVRPRNNALPEELFWAVLHVEPDKNPVLKIIPLRSVGDISFGQTPDEVRQAWGAPERTFTDKRFNTQHWDYDKRTISCHFNAEQQLELVIIANRSSQMVELFGNDIFAVKYPDFLKEAGISTTRDVDGFLVLTIRAASLGIDFCYEEEGTKDDMAVHVYAEPQKPLEEWVPGSPKRYLA